MSLLKSFENINIGECRTCSPCSLHIDVFVGVDLFQAVCMHLKPEVVAMVVSPPSAPSASPSKSASPSPKINLASALVVMATARDSFASSPRVDQYVLELLQSCVLSEVQLLQRTLNAQEADVSITTNGSLSSFAFLETLMRSAISNIVLGIQDATHGLDLIACQHLPLLVRNNIPAASSLLQTYLLKRNNIEAQITCWQAFAAQMQHIDDDLLAPTLLPFAVKEFTASLPSQLPSAGLDKVILARLQRVLRNDGEVGEADFDLGNFLIERHGQRFRFKAS